jgi:hypothetical protein
MPAAKLQKSSFIPAGDTAMNNLISLVYRSTQTAPMTLSDLRVLVERARIRNKRRNVTGALLYNGIQFMQCLEGAEDDVALTYSEVVADTRHRDSLVLLEHPADEREFGSWSMGYVPMFASDRLKALQSLGLQNQQLPKESSRHLLASFFRLDGV